MNVVILGSQSQGEARQVDCVWNVMAHAQKPYFFFQRNGRVHLNRRGASVQSTTWRRGVRISCSNAWYTMFRCSVRVLATHSIRQFPLHFPSRASPCTITLQLDSTANETAEVHHKILTLRRLMSCIYIIIIIIIIIFINCNWVITRWQCLLYMSTNTKMVRKCVCSIYIYDISSLKVSNLTLILLTWRKWWAPNNASK